MKYWTIAYQEDGSTEKMPVYEGVKDGRYYLGGSPRLLFPLLLSTKKDAELALKRVRIIENENEDGRAWCKNGKFTISRCEIRV